MKYLLILGIVIGCGKIEVQGDLNFRSTKSLSPITYSNESVEVSDLRDICQSLAAKEAVAATYLTGPEFVYQNHTKACDQGSLSFEKTSRVTVEDNGGRYFLKEGGAQYVFREFELKTSGSLAQICSLLDSGVVQSPIINGNDVTYFTTRDYASTDCTRNEESKCIKITKAVKVSETEGRPISVEWIRFKTRDDHQNNRGIWNYRQLATPTGCLDGQHFLRRANL